MDLPPAASASPSAAQFLPPSRSTTASHNSPQAGAVGQSGPRTQSAARPSTSALGVPPASQSLIAASGKCSHKDITRCSLHRGECCSCADNRDPEEYYERYADGGIVLDAPRWAHYCSSCRDYWDRLNARVPPYRENQPRITAWDLFHLVSPRNGPPSIPNLTLSESARHSLTPSAQAAILDPEDGFPPSYAVFQVMSPNFSNEYHPLVAQHIRAWGDLERKVANESRYSPEFHTLLAQYHNARYKAKRMTELDRQSRGGSMSTQAREEYFQLLNTPGPFDVPSTSSSGGNHESSMSGGGGRGNGSANHPNLGHIGVSFGRVASFGSFLQSTTAAPQPVGNSGGVYQGNNSVPLQTPTDSTHPPFHNNTNNMSSTTNHLNSMTSPQSQISHNGTNRRRGSTPSEAVPRANPSSADTNSSRQAPPVDRERERDRDRETGRINAGTFPSVGGPAASDILPSVSFSSSSNSTIPLPSLPVSPSEIPEVSRYHSHSLAHSLNPVATVFRSLRRARPLSSVTSDIETDRIAADRRRQLRERNESEWESMRPLSASSSSNANTNRTSADSTVMDAVMSDQPSSQSSDNSNGSVPVPTETARTSDNEPMARISPRHRQYFHVSHTSEPWNNSLLPGESSRAQPAETAPIGPLRREGSSSNTSTNTPLNTMSGSPITGIASFVFPANRRSLRPTLLDPTASPPAQSPPTESTTARNGLTSPTNRLTTNFLPSLNHIPHPPPRYSPPPRTLNRPRPGSVTNTGATHNRQNSNAGDGFSARRRERTANPLAQALGTRADAERDDYESPIRQMFTQNYEEYQRAEDSRRRFRELEAEQRELLRSPTLAGNPEAGMRRLVEQRQQRNQEFLHRTNYQAHQRQASHQSQPEQSSTTRSSVPGWYNPHWPNQNNPAGTSSNNGYTRSPDHSTALPFGITTEDDPSSTSEGDYEDLVPMDHPLNDDEGLFNNLLDNYLSTRMPPEAANRRRQRFRSQFIPVEDVIPLPGPASSSNRPGEGDPRERLPTRLERARRIRDRERDAETRFRQTEDIRVIANLVTSAREGGVMGFPHRWSREAGSGNPNSRNTNNNSSRTTRTLDHPERPENMKEEDLKITADCKVCYGQIADIVLIPCAHLVLCQWCADTVAPTAPNRPEGSVAPQSQCPVCRGRVEKKIKVFRC